MSLYKNIIKTHLTFIPCLASLFFLIFTNISFAQTTPVAFPEKISFTFENSDGTTEDLYIHMMPLKISYFGLAGSHDCDGARVIYPNINNFQYSQLESHMNIVDEIYRYRLGRHRLFDPGWDTPYFYHEIEFKDRESCRNSAFGYKNITAIRISFISPYEWGSVPESPHLWSLRWDYETNKVEVFRVSDKGLLKLVGKGKVELYYPIDKPIN